MNKSNYAIDRIRKIVMFDGTESSALFSLGQVEDFSLSATVDKTDIVDALGVSIMQLERSKKLEMSGTSSLFDIALLAAQYGTTVDESTADNKFYVPRIEYYTYSATAATYALDYEIPAALLGTGVAKYAYKVNTDGSVAAKYTYTAGTVGATSFKYATTDHVTTFTPPTGITAGDRFMLVYEWEANATDTAVRVVNGATNFSKVGRMFIECLFRDLCNKDTVYAGMIVCDNAQLDGNVDLSVKPDGKHPFKVMAMPAYCDTDKQLVTVIIPEAEAAA